MTRIVFDVDDVAPVMGYGLLKEDGEFSYLLKLHKEFGVKFTLFVIPFFRKQVSIEDKKDWVEWIKSKPYFEIECHGLTHEAIKPEYGGQEFLGIPLREVDTRLQQSLTLFKNCEVNCQGFRSPGWFMDKGMYTLLNNRFKYVGDHIIGVKPIKWRNLWRIPYTLSIDNLHSTHYDDVVIVHSHISCQDGNKNGWNEANYQSVRAWLKKMLAEHDKVEFITMREYVGSLE